MDRMTGWNDAVLEQFWATGKAERFGDGLVVLHTVGAKSGEPRVNPVAGIRQPDGTILVAATFAGQPRHPAWFHNLVADPELRVETSEVHDGVGLPMRAEVLEGAERDAGWAQFTAMSDGFKGYEAKTTRVFPVVRLVPAG
jgi:deazaflavin-dependent oxidoreductase (nitroreductase family)